MNMVTVKDLERGFRLSSVNAVYYEVSYVRLSYKALNNLPDQILRVTTR